VFDVFLLDHTRLPPERRFQLMTATGRKIETMFEKPGVDDLGRERLPFVLHVSGWPPSSRLSWSSGSSDFDETTMSEAGGLDDNTEFFRAAASCSYSLAITALGAASRASNRRQFAQDFRAPGFHGSLS
jgi:hypothetical protein